MSRLILPLTLCAFSLLASDPPAKPVSDRDLGLSRTSVFEAPAPPLYQDEASAPGEQPLPKRINRETPPVIPHSVADCVPITRSSNLCVDCHGVPGPKKKGEATPIPASHYVDLRRAPEAKGKQVAGARYVCISCHVPRTDAPPIVGSTYRP
jgi:cytochrome c-type protein NapB